MNMGNTHRRTARRGSWGGRDELPSRRQATHPHEAAARQGPQRLGLALEANDGPPALNARRRVELLREVQLSPQRAAGAPRQEEGVLLRLRVARRLPAAAPPQPPRAGFGRAGRREGALDTPDALVALGHVRLERLLELEVHFRVVHALHARRLLYEPREHVHVVHRAVRLLANVQAPDMLQQEHAVALVVLLLHRALEAVEQNGVLEPERRLEPHEQWHDHVTRQPERGPWVQGCPRPREVPHGALGRLGWSLRGVLCKGVDHHGDDDVEQALVTQHDEAEEEGHGGIEALPAKGVHDRVPVLARERAEEQQHAQRERSEVGIGRNDLVRVKVRLEEEVHAHDRVDEEDQHEERPDVHEGAHAPQQRLNESPQPSVGAHKAKEPHDAQEVHEPDVLAPG
mmetsp:Transcript_19840/g.67190  ORF Transcript_19840/g.67190 Transcript_19840/m.67190 type:complete len:400 (-) Transcript_19840:292-1491(-)